MYIQTILYSVFFSINNLNSRSLEGKKKLHEHLGGGSNRDPTHPSTFDITHPIDMIFGKYNNLHF